MLLTQRIGACLRKAIWAEPACKSSYFGNNFIRQFGTIMTDEDRKNRLGPLLKRMAELNAEANLLSHEIDEHLNHRASSGWDSEQPEADESATG